MAILNELVSFRAALLAEVKLLSNTYAITEKIEAVKATKVNNNTVGYVQELKHIIDSYKQMISESDRIVESTCNLITAVESDIDIMAADMFNSAEYADKFKGDALTINVHTMPKLSDDLNNTISIRIKRYCDWHYAGLNICSRSIEWNDCLVTCDPLYITANYTEVLDAVVASYPEQYQRRLRVYPMPTADINTLPNEQFGFVLAWEFFNYVAEAEIEQVLANVFKLLKAGGVFMFSYNNCDLTDSASLAEAQTMTFTNQRRISTIAQKLGYNIIAFENRETDDPLYSNISWAELRKPGQLTTVKAHQVLGQVIEK